MSHGGQCLAAFFVKMSGLFWPVLYIILHEFNPQTKEYSTSESNQVSFDANMQYAFTSLKILHHMLTRARSKYFPQNQKCSSNA